MTDAGPIDLGEERKKRKPKSRPPSDDDDGLRPAWEIGLQRNHRGRVLPTLVNLELILREHDAWRGLLVHDAFAERTLVVKSDDGREQPCTQTGHWRDIDTTRLRVWLEKEYHTSFSADSVDAVVDSVAHSQQRHPVREYLQGLQWDATQRLPIMLEKYFGAKPSEYNAEVARMWMISGVARVFEPGCQADYVIVLIGPQGARKSSALRVLAKGWSADTVVTIGDKDALQALHGVWIYEIAELAAIKGARDIERVKGFITSRVDHYRMPYGRRFIDSPRQCIFAGSTNEDCPLNDPTGNRRYWTVDCGDIDIKQLRADVDQLWAEAFARYSSGEAWYPDRQEIVAMCEAEQEAHMQDNSDPWIDIVRNWIDRSNTHVQVTHEDWRRFDEGMSTGDCLMGAIGIAKERLDRKAQMRMARILKQLGFEPHQPRSKGAVRERRYYRPGDWSGTTGTTGTTSFEGGRAAQQTNIFDDL